MMAIVAYFVFFLPLIMGAKSTFVRYHTNQSLVLVLSFFVWNILTGFVLGSIPVIGAIVLLFSWPVDIAFVVLWVIGLMNAANGAMKPLPVIGGITILK